MFWFKGSVWYNAYAWRSRIVGPLRGVANSLSRKAHAGSNPVSSASIFSTIHMPENSEQFEKKKRDYFVSLGRQAGEGFRLHKVAGLQDRNSDREKEWGNVSEHCLAEVARVDQFATLLQFPEDLRKDLKIAAAAHDFFKKGEKEIVGKILTWDRFEKASAEATQKMQKAELNERVIWLVNAVGHGSLSETQEILEKEELTPEDIAFLVMHYVDDYTIGSEWVEKAEVLPGGQIVNALDRRVAKNRKNEQYIVLDEEGRRYFDGETTFTMQERIGHQVEDRLSALVGKGEAKDLPMFIDAKIREAITTTR